MKNDSRVKKRIAVVGVTGYVGAELCRLLTEHPCFELTHALAREARGVSLASIWPHFSGLIDIECDDLDGLDELAKQVDAICFALPHRTSSQVIAPLFSDGPPACRIIDLSGDFRLPGTQTALYATHYKQDHVAPHLLDRFVYGLTEWNHEALRDARAVANPGCFATALNLMLAPMASQGLLPEQVTVFAATGSTGSGKNPGVGTHLPSRHSNYKLYKVLSHQHVPEVLALLESLGAASTKLSFIPASAPMTHGIFATAHVHTHDPGQLARCIAASYEAAAFVRVREGSPQLNHVVGSNFADIGVVCGDQELVVMCAIDNTLKGASGQAIQNLNLMFDLPETTGLLRAPSLP